MIGAGFRSDLVFNLGNYWARQTGKPGETAAAVTVLLELICVPYRSRCGGIILLYFTGHRDVNAFMAFDAASTKIDCSLEPLLL